ncbi:F214B protein, partial [Amia calva]|nr:F214B protein [Amia calva]
EETMRHIHVEIARKESPVELPAQEGDLPPPSTQTGGLDSGPGQGLLRPFGENEIKLQKVYQLSIFSQLGGFSDSGGQQTVGKQGGKRSLAEPFSEHKRPRLPGHGVAAWPDSPRLPEQLDTDSDQELPSDALQDETALVCSTGQHFSHTGMEVSPVKAVLGEGEGDTVELSPPGAEQPQASSTNGLASSEKTPCCSKQLGPLSTPGPSGCPAKRKLLASSDTGESCSEDEGPSTSKRSRLCLPHGFTVSCRSTDAKAAPFWNHLLPSARDRPKSSTDCTSVGRRLKSGLRLKSRQLRSAWRGDASRASRSSWPSASISRSLLGNFEESILKGRFAPSGRIEGFTAEIGASGSYCPQHATLPVEVTYYDTSEHSAPSPFLGVIHLELLGKKGYSVPKAGTIQVTLFNPNKTVVKMFLVTYNFGDMPVNHVTFLRHRIFLVPVEEGEGQAGQPEGGATDRKRILCYLIHLRFQSSKSGKIYLHDDIRLLFSRKSIEVDTGIPYELKSFTEVPRNPKYSPRV